MALEISGISANGMAAVSAIRAGRSPVQTSRSSSESSERKKPDPAPLRQTIREIENFSAFLNRRLKYSINPDTDQVIVKVIDRETDKVIKVLPPEALQRLHSRMKETIGLLFDETI
jgi:flagellar protein FlaG